MQSQYGMNSKAQQIHHMYIQYKFYIIFSHFFVTLTSAHNEVCLLSLEHSFKKSAT